MADKRGGRRVPNNPASYSGVGKNSKRTDGGPIRGVPSVQNAEDLQQGDRAKLEAGQRIAPIQRTPQPQIDVAQGGGRPQGGGGQLPEHLFGLPSTRPGEPETAGLPFGPGPGPEALTPQPQDDREVVLQWLASQPNAPQAIVDMQNDIRNSRMAPPPQPGPQPQRVTDAPLPEETEPLDEELAAEGLPEEEASPIEAVDEDFEEEPSPV